MKRYLLEKWNDFWFEWHYPHPIRYGGGPQGYKTFRKQRLFNVIMVGVIIFLSIVVLSSCNKVNDKRADMIGDYVQSIGRIKVDFDFKPEILKEIVKIRVKDSLKFCDSIMRIPVTPNKVTKESVNKFLKECDNNIEYYRKTGELTDLVMWAYVKDKGLSYLKYVDMDSTKVLSNVVLCKFSIINPYEKDKRIEITRLFFFTPDNSKIINSSNI